MQMERLSTKQWSELVLDCMNSSLNYPFSWLVLQLLMFIYMYGPLDAFNQHELRVLFFSWTTTADGLGNTGLLLGSNAELWRRGLAGLAVAISIPSTWREKKKASFFNESIFIFCVSWFLFGKVDDMIFIVKLVWSLPQSCLLWERVSIIWKITNLSHGLTSD